jgi:ABC-type lipoprotein release transport system permease subunit
MRLSTLLRRSLFFHWRANLAVFLGVVVGTAVLTGALLVGDSLRGSLRDLTLDRLGGPTGIDHALVSDRFFRAELAAELARAPGFAALAEHAVPAVLLRGTAIRRDAAGRITHRVGRVQVVGVDPSFWPLFGEQRNDLGDDLLLNEPLARELNVQAGDTVEVRLERPQAIPADALLGRPVDAVSLEIQTSPVRAVLPASGSGRFSLQAQQQRPLIVYVQLEKLQRRLRESTQQDRGANILLVAARPGAEDAAGADRLQALLRETVTLEDLGLTLRKDQSGTRYLALESRRLLLEPAVVESTLTLAREAGWDARPTLTYLANLISDAREPTPPGGLPLSGRYTPYSAVTGLDPSAGPPWGPFLRADGGTWDRPLAADEILINAWVAEDLWPGGAWRPLVGQPVVAVRYFVESDGWLLNEETTTFRLAGVTALDGPAADRTLTPDFPGLRGKTIQDWDPPFPREQFHRDWLRKRDDAYWDRYRATPKAFVAPETAQRLWRSRHGQYTAVRLAPQGAGDLDTLAVDFRARVRAALPPDALGLQFQPVRAQGLAAASSSTAESFGWLFLGFSLFLIVSAAMLVGLLFRLGVERRAGEVGLLAAAGYRPRTVRRLLLGEGAVLAGLGALVGLALAVGYAALLLAVLRSWWAETLQTSFLRLHIAPRADLFGPLPYPSLVLGFILSFGIGLLAILWALRGLGRLSPRSLLAGQATDEGALALRPARRWVRWLTPAALCAGVVLAVLGGLALRDLGLPAPAAPPLFFGSGAALLVGGLGVLALGMHTQRGRAVRGHGLPALVRLGARNLIRTPGRSLLTAGLLASATFLVVAVESFRQSTGTEADRRDSGTGGFALIAEADVPLTAPPGDPTVNRALNPDLGKPQLSELAEALARVEVYGLRVRPGDDVSCLNLYQPQRPRLLGVPDRLIDRGGFAFRGLWEPSAEEEQNPWLLLRRQRGDEVPVLLDDHTATWVLHKSPGDTWTIPDERGRPVTLRLVGLLHGSIFQSEVLLSEANFRKHFPSRGGYAFLLLDASQGDPQRVKQVLERAYGERYGLTVSRSLDRLAAFQAVENTYLSTFQVLGGLGVLLGTLGLAVVLLRNVWERRGELALLRAMGYRRAALGWLVLAENGALVVLGLAIGIAAALVAVTPHLVERAAVVPWRGILGLVALVLAFGLLAGGLAVLSTLRTPLLPALRRE